MLSKLTSGSTRAISCISVRIAPKYVGSVIVHRFPGHSSLQSLHKLFDISQQSMTLVLGWLLALFLGRLSPQSAGQPQLSLKTNSNVFSFPSHPPLAKHRRAFFCFYLSTFYSLTVSKMRGQCDTAPHPHPHKPGSSFNTWGTSSLDSWLPCRKEI